MPRYFFNVHDGYASLDVEGTELADIYTAQGEAIRMAGQILSDMGAKFLNHHQWKLEIVDEHTAVLFALHIGAEERPKLAA